MRILTIAIVATAALLGISGAHAQAESRQERHYDGINQSIGQQQRMQQQLQQNQFETNQIRQNIQRNQLFTPPPTGPGPGLYRR